MGSRANAWDWSDDWWAKSFNQAAGTLQEIRAQGSPDSSASADTAQLDTSEAASPPVAEAAEQRPSAATTGLDRWGGFRSRAGKLARVMRQEALVGPEPAAPSAEDRSVEAGPQRKKRKASRAEKKQGRTESAQERAQSRPEQRSAPKVIEVVTQGPEPEPYVLPPRPSNWWGATRFVSSGCMGSMREKEVKDKQGFTEDDQVRPGAAQPSWLHPRCAAPQTLPVDTCATPPVSPVCRRSGILCERCCVHAVWQLQLRPFAPPSAKAHHAVPAGKLARAPECTQLQGQEWPGHWPGCTLRHR